MNFDLTLSQEQKLIMTQEMQLSVKLLQMSSLELQEHIEKEIQENPVLEYSDEEDNDNSNAKVNYKEFIKYLSIDNYGHQNYDKNEDELSPFYFAYEKKSLRQFLKDQIGDLGVKDFCRRICDNIIDNLDEKGYLDIETKEIAKNLNVEEKHIIKALKTIQSLDPAGIGAKNLKECLKLQLKRKKCRDKNLYYIIDNHIEDIAENKYNVIAKAINIDTKKAQEYGDMIKSLKPKPSSGFYTGEEIKFIVPDAYIRNINGKYEVIMNEDLIPNLKINNIYREIIDNDKDKEAVEYIKQKLNNAVFLIKSIEHRKSTIYRVLEKIVELQKDYFETGENCLKPMTLKDISESLNVHESTVSRAIKEKYINVNKGTVKIKDLFTAGLSSKYSIDDISTNLIKKEIKYLIDLEDKINPLSDQILCEELNKRGMNISRRTVAKYREEIGIKSSSKRKRF
jgi:RNA polymerase sigma-54 factor